MSAKHEDADEGTAAYSVTGYEDRARQCVTLANQARDTLIRAELLKLRQTYLTIAQRLRQQGFEEGSRGTSAL